LIGVIKGVQPRSLGACVGNLQDRLCRQFVLGRDVPLLHVGVDDLGIELQRLWRVWVRQRRCREAVGKIREPRNGTVCLSRIRICRRRATWLVVAFRDEKWGIKARTGIGPRSGLIASVKDPISRAEYSVISDFVCESNPWRKIILVGRYQPARRDGANWNAGGNQGSELSRLPLGNQHRLG